MADDAEIASLLELYEARRHDLRIFMEGVVTYIGEHPNLNKVEHRIVHSYKSRLKDPAHLKDKINRKNTGEKKITSENLFQEITDLAGIRILHLYQDEFRHIDAVIRQKISDGDWVLGERARAYTWDPENIAFFGKFDLEVAEKPTSYTRA